MKHYMAIAALCALGACAPQIPDSGAGVGLEPAHVRLERERAARDAALEGRATIPNEAAASTGAQVPAGALVDQPDSDLLQASPNNPAPVAVGASGLSAENDFNRVGELRSIEDDAERLRQNRENYQVVQPSALPSRSGSGTPNIVDYALSTSNARGQQVYRRYGLNKDQKFQRNCAKYPSPDLAQIDFLSNGGPQRDRLGLDPDGDGFACTWDPAPFRSVARR